MGSGSTREIESGSPTSSPPFPPLHFPFVRSHLGVHLVVPRDLELPPRVHPPGRRRGAERRSAASRHDRVRGHADPALAEVLELAGRQLILLHAVAQPARGERECVSYGCVHCVRVCVCVHPPRPTTIAFFLWLTSLSLMRTHSPAYTRTLSPSLTFRTPRCPRSRPPPRCPPRCCGLARRRSGWPSSRRADP
jgi:hypothetical protein